MKYGELIEHLIETYGCSDYNEQKYFQFKEWTEDMFGLKRKGKQTSLSEWINWVYQQQAETVKPTLCVGSTIWR